MYLEKYGWWCPLRSFSQIGVDTHTCDSASLTPQNSYVPGVVPVLVIKFVNQKHFSMNNVIHKHGTCQFLDLLDVYLHSTSVEYEGNVYIKRAEVCIRSCFATVLSKVCIYSHNERTRVMNAPPKSASKISTFFFHLHIKPTPNWEVKTLTPPLSPHARNERTFLSWCSEVANAWVAWPNKTPCKRP